MKRQLLLLCFCMFVPLFLASAQNLKTEHVFLITLDGMRWQEVFEGADKKLINSEKYSGNTEQLKNQFWHHDPLVRRKLLMPFFWSVLEGEGRLAGNRNWGNKMNLTTKKWISFPGYNEMLTGYADPELSSNAYEPNKNVTVLEWINRQPGFEGKVAVFASWETFPYIINEERSGIPVNAGYEPVTGPDLSRKEEMLNKLQEQIPPHWGAVRHDAFTHHYAMEHLRKHKPRLIHIAYGETDDFAHNGRYDAYLNSAYQTDAFIRELWEWAQSQEEYRDKTTFIITTDHGRGYRTKREWKKHGRIWYPGSDETWIAILGPDTPAVGELKTKAQYYQYQVAETIAYFLGMRFEPAKAIAPVITANP